MQCKPTGRGQKKRSDYGHMEMGISLISHSRPLASGLFTIFSTPSGTNCCVHWLPKYQALTDSEPRQ